MAAVTSCYYSNHDDGGSENVKRAKTNNSRLADNNKYNRASRFGLKKRKCRIFKTK